MARANNNQSNSTDLTVVQAPRLPYPIEAREFGISEGQWLALVDAVFPAAQSVHGVMLALNYAKSRNLDVFKRVVHIVPMWNSALGRNVETVWPGINELRTTAMRTGVMAGIDDCQFGPTLTRGFSDSKEVNGRDGKKTMTESCAQFSFPEWAQVTVYRMLGGVRCAFVGPKVRFTETFSGLKGLRVPNPRWQLAPWQMLEKCAEAAALRRAFPEELGDQPSAEEMDGKIYDGVIEGQFEVVDSTAGKQASDGSRSDAKPTRDDVAKQLEQIKAHIEEIRAKVKSSKSIDDLRRGLDIELEFCAQFPPEYLELIDPIFKTRIDELNKAKAKAQPEQNEQHDDDAAIKKYVEGFKADCEARAGNMPDLNSLWAREKVCVDKLPQNYQDQCLDIFNSAKAGKLSDAATDSDQTPRTENDDEQENTD